MEGSLQSSKLNMRNFLKVKNVKQWESLFLGTVGAELLESCKQRLFSHLSGMVWRFLSWVGIRKYWRSFQTSWLYYSYTKIIIPEKISYVKVTCRDKLHKFHNIAMKLVPRQGTWFNFVSRSRYQQKKQIIRNYFFTQPAKPLKPYNAAIRNF